MSLGNTVKGVKDTPALKNKRYANKFKWDSRAGRGRGAFVKIAKTKSDRNDYR